MALESELLNLERAQCLLDLNEQIRCHLTAFQNKRDDAKLIEKLDSVNTKGDRQYEFDRQVNDILLNWLKNNFDSGQILSEEYPDCFTFGEAEDPEFLFICDPVDGSDNFSRGLPFSSISVAALKPSAFFHPKNVLFSMVGNLRSSSVPVAGKSEGAWDDGRQLKVSTVRQLKDAFISCELNHYRPSQEVGTIMRDSRAVRSYGCASQAIIQVARGALDAHIDVRSRLTPESLLAAGHILLESGGAIYLHCPHKENDIDSLTDKVNLIVASTAELLDEIKNRLFGAEAFEKNRSGCEL